MWSLPFCECGGNSGDCPQARAASALFLDPSSALHSPEPPSGSPRSLLQHRTPLAHRIVPPSATSPPPLAWRLLPSLSPITLRKHAHFGWPTMATPSLDQGSTTAQNIAQSTSAVSRTEPSYDTLSTSPVEMETLSSAAGTPPTRNTTTQNSGAPHVAPVEFTNISEISPSESTQPLAPSSATPAARTELTRAETEAALGPSTDGPAANPDNTNGPTLVIMLLLTTGARHPYKIDEKYLKKRNVTVEDMDPYSISVYTLKELIWRDWREGTSQQHVCTLFHCARRITMSVECSFSITLSTV